MRASGVSFEHRMSEIITANRLADGVVVFQNADGGWDDDFNRAAVHAGKEEIAAALTRARLDEGRNLVVDAYAVEVEARNGHYAPKALREAIRAAGPTTRRDLGKQALGLSPHAGPHARMETSYVSL
jgi:sulfite reductase (NADPH) hemoprotein beta-component